MATNDSTITYELLTPQDELTVAANALHGVEQQHYQITISRLGLTLPAENDAGANQLAQLVSQIEALQAEYNRVKGEVDAAEAAQPAS